MKTARNRAYLYLLICTMIWGFAPPVIKFTLREFSSEVFLFYRFAISAVISVIIITQTKDYRSKSVKTHLPRIFIYALFSTTFSLGALFAGLERTSVLEMNLLTSMTPLLIVIAGALVFKERVPHREKLGAFLAFIGTIVAVVLPIASGSENEIQLIGNFFILLHMGTDITAILVLKELLRKKVPSTFLASVSFIVGFFTISPLVLMNNSFSEIINEIIATPFVYHLGVWYMALLSGTLAYYLRNMAQKTVEVGKAGIFGYLGPLFSAPLAILWLGEKLTVYLIAGAILIAIGVFIAERPHHFTHHK